MAKTLDEQIEERQQQAEDKKLFEKANLVARKLGGRDEDSSESYILVHVFNDAASSLEVRQTRERDNSYQDWPDNGTIGISFKGKPVFEATSESSWYVKRYAPGDWENKLDAFYAAAQQVVAKEQAEAARIAAEEKAAAEKEADEQRRAQEKEKRERWGLESEEPHDIAAERQQRLKKMARPAASAQ